MPSFNQAIKNTLLKASTQTGALAGRFLVPTAAAIGTRALLNHALTPTTTLSWLGQKVVAEQASYWVFGLTASYGPVAGAAMMHAAFKGGEYAIKYMQERSYQKNMVQTMKEIEESNLDLAAMDLEPEDTDGLEDWSVINTNALTHETAAKPKSGFGSFFYKSQAKTEVAAPAASLRS